jgi:hypothetical protein
MYLCTTSACTNCLLILVIHFRYDVLVGDKFCVYVFPFFSHVNQPNDILLYIYPIILALMKCMCHVKHPNDVLSYIYPIILALMKCMYNCAVATLETHFRHNILLEFLVTGNP